MKTYYVSFTIADDPDYSRRYEALMGLLRGYDVTCWWAETTSFVLIRTDKTAAQIADDIEAAIDTSKDIALIGCTHYKTLLVVGASDDDDIFKLVDFAKKA